MEEGALDRPGAALDQEEMTTPQKFSVCIRILEARQLAGIDVDPFVRVSIGKEEKQTRARKSTASPTFEEDLFFEYQLTPAVFFDQVIKITAFSAARLLRRRKLIGEFQIDVATVYHQPGHFFFEKWALLVDPKEPLSPPKGYVLCTIVIERPSEVFKMPASKRGMEDEDIENNLLVPETFQGWTGDRDPAHYIVTIYRAEDLPSTGGRSLMASMKKALRSVSDTTEYADPFVTVCFAGKQGKTAVIANNMNPEWNEKIIFCDMFPTFSESIRLHVRDAHQGVIATSILDFKVISDNSVESGFPPTFGPSYLNLYGSFRGNTEPNPMNFALAEGVAYRGRLLVSVEIQPMTEEKGKVTLHKVESQPHKLGAEGFNDTKEKFFLFCCILEASMIDKRLEGRHVHFELSIGKYGTTEYSNECNAKAPAPKKSVASKVCDSDDEGGDHDHDHIPLMTQPSTDPNTPYETVCDDEDGCVWRSCTTPIVAKADEHYCSVPFGVKKPCMFVVSQWEDYTYRFSHVNQLTQLVKKYERKLADVERALEMSLEVEARLRLRHACDTLITSFSEYTSYLESEFFQDDLWHTELDKLKNKQRRRQIDLIAKWCRDFRPEATNPHNDIKVKLEEAVTKLHGLKHLATDAQEVMPDIFLWLISGNRRVAYRRFKPYDLMFSDNRQERGISCGKVQSFFLKVPGSGNADDNEQFPVWGHVTAYLWLGRSSEKAGYLHGLPKACQPPSTVKEESDPLHVPPQYMHYKESHTYELRCHIYQGRALMASDDSGLSDPFVRVILGGHVKQTQIIEQSVNPIWDECLVMPQVELLGSARFVKQCPPSIIIQVYDYDQDNTYEFIGLAEVQPVVKLAQEPYAQPEFPPKLRWYPLFKSNHRVGEVLACFELIQLHKDMIDYYHAPSAEETDAGPIVPIPATIRPKLSKYQIQAMFWGVRDIKSGKYFNQVKPVIEIECAGMVLESDPILDYAKHQNFSVIMRTLDVDLPDDPVYQPPIIIRCVEKKSFGRCTLLGSTTIPSLSALVHRDGEMQEEKDESELLALDDEDYPIADEEEGETEAKQSVMSYQESLLAESEADEQHHTEDEEIHGEDSVIVINEQDEHGSDEESEEGHPTSRTGGGSSIASRESQPGAYHNEAFASEGSASDSEQDTRSRRKSRAKSVAAAAGGQDSAEAKSTGGAVEEGESPTRKSLASVKAMEEGQPPISSTPRSARRKKQEIVLDWWSKYYASVQKEAAETKLNRFKGLGQNAMKGMRKKAGKLAKKLIKASASKIGSGDQRRKRMQMQKRRTEDADDNTMELLKKMDIAKLEIYSEELENQPEFHHFRDCFDVYPLYKGKRTFTDYDDLARTVGKFKGRLCVIKHPIPEDFDANPTFPSMVNEKQVLIVRVYVVRAHALMANDRNGRADPYLMVTLGKKKISDRSHKINAQLNPTFGRMFEFEACLPEDYELLVQVWDWDRITQDDLIGQTKIDIEQRYYSKHRAVCGLPQKYEATGYNAWRDTSKPTLILTQLCRQYGLSQPSYSADKVTVGQTSFVLPKPKKTQEDKDEEKKNKKKDSKDKDNVYVQSEENSKAGTPIIDRENLALVALRNLKRIPEIGYDLVPEHVECRPLYMPDKPGTAQGILEMWVDIFPKDAPRIPEPIDIKPRKPKSFELRVVIYDTKNVILDDYNVLTGMSTVDQYVKGFIAGPDVDGQETDTHYRSLKGEGNFNWRFIFRFDYSDIENKIFYKCKHTPLALTSHEEKIPPELHLQVWDADEITSDDYLGETVFNLTKVPRGSKTASSCNVKIMKRSDTINLFAKHSRKVRAWWPFVRREADGTEILAGKVDMSLELLTEEEALRKPAGKAHDGPDPMPEPVRPETSFAWFTSPLKFLKYTVWMGMRWRVLMCFLVFLVIIFLLVFIYELPQAGADRLIRGDGG